MFKNFSHKEYSIIKRTNISIIRPSLIWVVNGQKKIFMNKDILTLNPGELLFINNDDKLSFVNKPINNIFLAKQISFLSKPDKEMISLSKGIVKKIDDYPIIKLTSDLKKNIEFFHSLDTTIISNKIKLMIANVIYMQLAEKGLLHILFPFEDDDIEIKLCLFLSNEPNYKHSIINSCSYLGVSRSTLIRHLNKKNTTFKLLLRKVRMKHAMFLIKQGCDDIDTIALDCGYQSTHRFQNYFKEEFNVSLKKYISDLI